MRKYKPTGRPRGAPLGNTNNLKHGIYSRFISAADDTGLQDMPLDKIEQELALARVRLTACMQEQSASPHDQWPEYERLITRYLRIIVSLIEKNAVRGKHCHSSSGILTAAIKRYREQTGLLFDDVTGEDREDPDHRAGASVPKQSGGELGQI